MRNIFQFLGFFLVTSFLVSCTDKVGPELEKGVKLSSINGTKLEKILSDEETKLRSKGHKIKFQWAHRKVNKGTYKVLAEMLVLDAPKLNKIFEWNVQKSTSSPIDNHWLVRADNKDTKKLVLQAK